MNFLSPERREFYRKKKVEQERREEELKVVREDALFIKYYGMDAFLKLFPEAIDFGTNWHRDVVSELQRMERRALANQLSGFSMAVGATKSKKAARKFKSLIRNMLK